MVSHGTRSIVNSCFIFTTFGAESMAAINDCRMLLALIAILILTDLWWGSRESQMRYREALQEGRKTDAEKWKFRKSRAGRRTMNKLVDYITYFLLGLFLGLSVFRELGVDHVLVASVFVSFGALFEVISIIGHILAVHHVQAPKVTWKSFWRFAGKVLVRIIKSKSPDTGAAIEEVISETKDDESK